jgi:Asp-tRNA(Asn)/Glu-tRNA(Gln) amidotransferase A subunit family amidase
MTDLAARCRPVFDSLFGPALDVVLTLSAPGEAPMGLHATGDHVMNAMWTALHAPCVAIPCGTGPNGLPVGVQFVGPRHGDARLLAIAETTAAAIDPAAG